MAGRKHFLLRLEVEIHAVSCPGFWPDQSGDVTLRVRTLDSSATTTPASPVFPLLCQERLIFQKGPVPPKVEVSTKTLLEETSSTDDHAGERATHTACSNCDSTSSAPAAALCQCRQRRRSTSQLGRCSRPLSHCDDCDGCTCHTGPLQKELQARSKSCCSHTRSREDRSQCRPRRRRKPLEMLTPVTCDMSDTTRPRSSSRSEKPVPYRQLFYDNLDKFYKQLHQNCTNSHRGPK